MVGMRDFCLEYLHRSLKRDVCSCRIIELNGGQPPLTYKRFQTLISRLDPPEMPVETLSDTLMGCCVTPVSEDHGEKYGVPSLEELGKKKNKLLIREEEPRANFLYLLKALRDNKSWREPFITDLRSYWTWSPISKLR